MGNGGTEFLEKQRPKWAKLLDMSLPGLSEPEAQKLRPLIETCVAGEFAQLSDIILNCSNRFQFAKTYAVLRENLKQTLSLSGNPNEPQHINDAVKTAFGKVGQAKLDAMAEFFFISMSDQRDQERFFAKPVGERKITDVIEHYAGSEGVRGCTSVILLAILVGGVMSLLC